MLSSGQHHPYEKLIDDIEIYDYDDTDLDDTDKEERNEWMQKRSVFLRSRRSRNVKVSRLVFGIVFILTALLLYHDSHSDGNTSFDISNQEQDKAIMFNITTSNIIFKASHNKTNNSSSITSTFQDMSNSCNNECPASITSSHCSVKEYPVMGGLDMVQYFSFPNESYVGKVGTSQYMDTFLGYTYYFLNEDNRKIFSSNPQKYAPMWGGKSSH